MEKFRFIIALWFAKFTVIALKITGHNGTNFPGVVAIKICPGFMKYIGKPSKIIGVTGTNGKTTVSNMILDALTMDGKKVVHNRAGSNISSGIATTLIQNAGLSGKCKKEIGVIEVDERSALRVFPYIIPDYMLITNLSRDSIMRNAHPEYIAGILSKYIPERTKLVLNADDMFCMDIASKNDRVYFGIKKMSGDRKNCENLIQDYQVCPKCLHKLEYEYVRYSHIGRAYCPVCGLHAPEYDYGAWDVNTEKMTVTIKDRDGSQEYRLPNESVYNIYNVVSAVSMLREMGYSQEKVKGFFEKMNILGSRYEKKEVDGISIHLMLAKDKNAFAISRVFDYVSQSPGDKEIIIMNSSLSDIKKWSENTCWLYDCDFEFLKDEKVKNIVLCGPRAMDYRLRLLLAGVDESRISYTDTYRETPEQLKLFDKDNVYILYGSDSIDMGNETADRVARLIKAKKEG